MRRIALALVLICASAATASASLSSCVDGLRHAAVHAGVSRAVADKALSNVAYDEKAVRFSRSQPEYRTPIWDYMTFLVDPQRIADGKAKMKQYDRTLRAVEKAYGVDRYILAALWGIESDYGAERGDFYLPHALANVACAGRKKAFFRSQLIAVLKLVSRGDLTFDELYGSWAGAFGQTQFLATTYMSLAVDFDKDGRRDLVKSVPDALASTANFLRKSGWRPGVAWGYEVTVPKGYKGPHGRKGFPSAGAWAKRGIRKVGGGAPDGGSLALLLPAGRSGPAFLVSRNFNALYSYNAAISYALAIGHLSDRLRGRGPLAGRWPTPDPGLTRAQRLELQKRLIRNGYDIGEADGKIGPITIKAIKKAQAKAGLKPTGRPSMSIYKALGGS